MICYNVWTGAALKTCIKMFNMSCNTKKSCYYSNRQTKVTLETITEHALFIFHYSSYQDSTKARIIFFTISDLNLFRLFSLFFTFIIICLCTCFIFVPGVCLSTWGYDLFSRFWYLLPFFLYLCSFILINFLQSARIVSYIRNNRFWNHWTCTFCIEIFV